MADHAIAVPVTTVWTAPDAPREVDAPAIAERPDVSAWTSSMDTATRLDLHGRTLTQALLGEPAGIVEERAGWVRIVLPWQPSGDHPDGYPGWVPASHIGAAGEPSERAVAVTTASAKCRTPEGVVSLSYGTQLPALDVDAERTTVALPGGRDGSIATADVGTPGPDPSAADWIGSLLASARQFLGLRYLWGGMCGWGFDCSSFVHLVHRVHGVRMPRDARDQLPAARPVPLDAARPGALYFFARPGERAYHVGFVTGPGPDGQPTMLHAPEGTELIEETALAPARLDHLVGAGSFGPEPGR